MENKAETSQSSETQDNKKIKRKIGIVVAVLLTIVAVYFAYDMSLCQTTDDAYVEATTVSDAPKVSGEIIEV